LGAQASIRLGLPGFRKTRIDSQLGSCQSLAGPSVWMPALPGGEQTMSMDLALEAWVSGLIELSKFKWMLGAGRRWQPGEKLKLFFTGYNGTRNTGADVRVEEMLRQINHILGPDKCELSVLTQNFQLTDGYFK